MSVKEAPAEVPVEPEVKGLSDVDANMLRHANLQKTIDEDYAAFNAEVSRKKKELDEKHKPARAEQKRIEKANTAYLKRNRSRLIRQNGKVIKLTNGVVAFRIVARHLTTPKSAEKAIEFLKRRRGGKKFLNVEYSLNRDAITHGGSRLLRQLAPFGIKAGRDENLTMKPKGYKDPINLDTRPYNVRKR